MNQSPADVILNDISMQEEFRTNLGDDRRSDRLIKFGEQLSKKPDSSYPEQLNHPKDLEAFYRFLRNENVSYDDVCEPHRLATVERAEMLKEVLVLHDTTEFNFPVYENTIREGLCRFSTNRQGFLAHASLVISADGSRCPLGLLEIFPFVYKSQLIDKKAEKFWIKNFGAMDSVYDRWLKSINKTAAYLENVKTVIHVADREIDAYEHFAHMVENNLQFVFRLTQNRCAKDSETSQLTNIRKIIEQEPILGTRVIELQARKPSPKKSTSKSAQAPRNKRKAKVGFRAKSILIQRPKTRNDLKQLPKEIKLNIVQVIELDPPKGEEPIDWLLATTEPIDSIEDVLRVIDIYRSRWLVEEYFKSLKTGCSYEKRQLDTAKTLLIALAITIPIAWKLLVLRYLNREAPEYPASKFFSDPQLLILKSEYPKQRWSDEPTIQEATLAVAKLGGHIKQNGDPGWLVLGRGYMRVLERELGWFVAQQQIKRE